MIGSCDFFGFVTVAVPFPVLVPLPFTFPAPFLVIFRVAKPFLVLAFSATPLI